MPARRRRYNLLHARRYEARSLVLLGGRQVHKLVNFVREAWLIDKREMEQAQLFETADERGCTPMFGAGHRRESACIGGSPTPPGGGVAAPFCPPPRPLVAGFYINFCRKNECKTAPTDR